MMSRRGRVSKDAPEAFEGASAARVNLCLSKWRRFSPVSSHFCSCLISEAGFKGTRSQLHSLLRKVRCSRRSDPKRASGGETKIYCIMNVGELRHGGEEKERWVESEGSSKVK